MQLTFAKEDADNLRDHPVGPQLVNRAQKQHDGRGKTLAALHAHEADYHQHVPGHSQQQVNQQVGVRGHAFGAQQMFGNQEDGLDHRRVEDAQQRGAEQRAAAQQTQP